MTKRKPRQVCPSCGVTNFVIPTLIKEKHMNNDGKIFYVTKEYCKIKCFKCGCIWSETNDIEKRGL